jgi:hypothetical protein
MNGADAHPDYIEDGMLHRWVSIEPDDRLPYGQEKPRMGYVGEAYDDSKSKKGVENIDDGKVAKDKTDPEPVPSGPPGGGDAIVFAPNNGPSWTYTKDRTSDRSWCNIYTNNKAIADGGSPDTDTIINHYPIYSFNHFTKKHNASKTKTPFNDTAGIIYYWWQGNNLVQPQHMEYYKFINGDFTVYEGWGEYDNTPQGIPRNPDNYLQQCKDIRGSNIVDLWFVPLRPTN